jgi:hypothetical protein
MVRGVQDVGHLHFVNSSDPFPSFSRFLPLFDKHGAGPLLVRIAMTWVTLVPMYAMTRVTSVPM